MKDSKKSLKKQKKTLKIPAPANNQRMKTPVKLDNLKNKNSPVKDSKNWEKSVRSIYIPDIYWDYIERLSSEQGLSKNRYLCKIFHHLFQNPLQPEDKTSTEVISFEDKFGGVKVLQVENRGEKSER